MDIAFIVSLVLVASASFVLGMLTFEQHERKIIRPHKQLQPAVTRPEVAAVSVSAVPPALNDRLLQQTQTDYQAALGASTVKFNQDLASTSELINNEIRNLSSLVIANELEQYREGLIKLRQQAIANMGSIEQAVEAQREVRMVALEEEIATEKQRLVAQIDTKLGDAVSSFLLETLQHNVDLGAQSGYLMSVLEEHKDEIKKEVANEV